MSVTMPSVANGLAVPLSQPEHHRHDTQPGSGKDISFQHMLEKLLGRSEGSLETMPKLQDAATLQPKSYERLLLLQIQTSRLALRVEMVSKVADGMLSLTRRLQGGQ